jgi:hypothetical protein
VNRPEPDAGPDRETAARARLGQTRESTAAAFGITRARVGQDLHEVRAKWAAAVRASGGRLPALPTVSRARGKHEQENLRQAGDDTSET